MSLYILSDRKLVFKHFKNMPHNDLVALLIEKMGEKEIIKLIKELKEAKVNEKI